MSVLFCSITVVYKLGYSYTFLHYIQHNSNTVHTRFLLFSIFEGLFHLIIIQRKEN